MSYEYWRMIVIICENNFTAGKIFKKLIILGYI